MLVGCDFAGVEEIYPGKRFRGDQVQRHAQRFVASFVRGLDARRHRDCSTGGVPGLCERKERNIFVSLILLFSAQQH